MKKKNNTMAAQLKTRPIVSKRKSFLLALSTNLQLAYLFLKAKALRNLVYS